MKKLFAIVAMVAACSFGANSTVMAQEEASAADTTLVADSTAVDSAAVEEPAVEEPAAPVVEEQTESLHKALKTKFIEGGADFMSLVKYPGWNTTAFPPAVAVLLRLIVIDGALCTLSLLVIVLHPATDRLSG